MIMTPVSSERHDANGQRNKGHRSIQVSSARWPANVQFEYVHATCGLCVTNVHQAVKSKSEPVYHVRPS